MSFTIKYNEKLGGLIGEVSGVLTPESVKQYYTEVVRKASKHQCNRLLTDLRKATLQFSNEEIYALPDQFSKIGITKEWKRAILATKKSADLYFFEFLAKDEDYQVRVFTDPKEAIKWLQNKP